MAISIALDPGHGGVFPAANADPGCSAYGVCERDLNLLIAQAAGQVLKAHKYPVIYTRTTNAERPALTQRGRIASRASCVFVIHINAAANESASGARIYHMPRASNAKRIAESVFANFPRELISKTSSVIEADESGHYDRVRNVLKYSLCPSVLLECGFITNDIDRKLLQDPQTHRGIAAAILSAVRALEAANVMLPNV